MKRTRTNNINPLLNPTAILTSDWHIREDTPVCRLDDFWETQWRKIAFISDLQKKYDCPVWHAGDLFEKPRPSLYLASVTAQFLPDNFWTIYGNHDLPNHSLELREKSGIHNLYVNDRLHLSAGAHWGQKLGGPENYFMSDIIHNRKVVMFHTMTYQVKQPWPGCTDPKSAKLLRMYPDYDLIVTGHNHQSFVEEHEGRLLVNPGAITRQTADMDNYLYVNKPSVYLWYAETNTVKRVFIPVEDDVITRDHIEQVQVRDARMEAFISKLKNNFEASISFEENVERMIAENEVKDEVQQLIYNAIDE